MTTKEIAKEEAPRTTLCPICHEPRDVHRCSTGTEATVNDDHVGKRSSRVFLSVFCRHPDTYAMVERARRYHHIEPAETSENGPPPSTDKPTT